MGNSYGFLGQVYDELSKDIPYDYYAKKIFEKVGRLKNKKILEIGGGSGLFTKYFQKAKEIHFLEPSRDMMKKAKKRIGGNISYYLEGIETFETEEKFDLILANLNIFNYIQETAELFKIFQKVHSWLKEEGFFIFDINSPYKLRKILGNETYIYEAEDIFYTWENFHEEPYLYSRLNFFLLEEDGKYRREEEELVERIYEIEEICELLEMAGFSEIEILDYDTFSEKTLESQRIVLINRKSLA